MIKYVFVLGLLLPNLVAAQTITGRVTDRQSKPLAGATVYWLGKTEAVMTDAHGAFVISIASDREVKKLIASHAGYGADTVLLSGETVINFQLQRKELLEEVIVSGYRSGVIISDRNPIKTEQITQLELKKAACCDLAGCFETQSTVYPQTTNVITNSKELRILGLSGVYNQVLIDGLPAIQGLTYTYGISSVPGTLVDNIYVAKGANSVLQGYESISGQINVETKDPDKTDKLLLNYYMNSFGEKHVNANYAFQKNKWSNLTAFHTVQRAGRTDRDKDSFLDLPLLTRYLVVNKWKYGNEAEWGWNSKVTVRFLQEERIGGQLHFDPVNDKGSDKVYGQSVQLKQPELLAKLGYRLNDKHYFSFYTSSFRQQQEAFFGTTRYDAQQTNFYSNLQHELSYGHHNLKTGISYRHLNLQEDIGFTDDFLDRSYDGAYRRVENIPGVFAENTLQFFARKLTWMAGVRADHHNRFGTMITPRTLVKYDVLPKTVIRANIGTGWRTVNLFSENIGLLASSRDIVFVETLRPEKALNTGINLTQKFDVFNNFLSGYLSADFYQTKFYNQVFPDYDTDPTKAFIQNFTGTSKSNGFQAELYTRIGNRVETKLGYNFLDVYRRVNKEKEILPFNPAHRFITSVGYKPSSGKFHMDMNLHWYGRQRLPDTKSNPAEHQRPDFSAPYTVINAQVTYNFKKVELYGGCENILDFRQRRPIISWQDPFSPYFDTSSVWGPTRGREFYIGIRFSLKREEEKEK